MTTDRVDLGPLDAGAHEPDIFEMRRAVRDAGLCSAREAQDLPFDTLRELWALCFQAREQATHD